jgi:MoaA/NifB/PqqE/SkfB family radical SAM enzyme
MYLRMAKRLFAETDKRLVAKLAWNMGVKGFVSVQRHKWRLKRGEFFPPFLYLSVINSCNLRCQGCWVDVSAKQAKIELDAANRVIREAKEMGNSFFGILGGEPFMHPQLLDIFAAHQDVYFQVFTNGHFITNEVAKELRRLGNVTPLVSVEGTEFVSDQRRGRLNVYSKTMEGLTRCLENKLLTGVCTSVCQSNIDDLLTDVWVERLIQMGVMYCWFHVYRPVGPEPCQELALTPGQLRRVRQFVVDTRANKPIVVIDAYHDGEGQALCPAATGFTHHISPWGDIEPCPVIQFAKESIFDDRPLKETIGQSTFLREFRELAATHTRGCIIMERPDLLHALVERHDAYDSTARKTAFDELAAIQPHPSQYCPGDEIPERNLVYRLAKRWCFNDFGAYQKYFHAERWRDPRENHPDSAALENSSTS